MPNWWDQLESPSDTNAPTPADEFMDQSGLSFIDNWMGGQLSQATQQNLDNPYYDPTYDQRIRDQQQADLEKRVRIQNARQQLLQQDEANGNGYSDLGYADRALLGLGSGLTDLGRQAGGVLEAIPGVRPIGKALAGASTAAGKEFDDLTDVPKGNLGGEFTQWITRNAASIIPSIGAGLSGGFPAAVAAAGLQSFGGIYEDAKDKYIERGLSEDDARAKAYRPALFGGAITAALTFAFGRTGVEAITKGITVGELREVLRRPIETVVKGASKEALEEGLDQLSQGVEERLTYNPDKTWDQIIGDTITAGAAGGLLGGAGETVTAGRLNAARGLRRFGRGGQVEAQTETQTTNQNQPGPLPQPDTNLNFNQTVDQSLRPTASQSDLDAVNGILSGPLPDAVAQRRGLRRGTTSLPLGVRILTAFGLDADTADQVLSQFGPPASGDLEQYRSDLLNFVQRVGITPEANTATYSENPETYIRSGFSPEQAAEHVRNAKIANDQTRQRIKQENISRLQRAVAPQQVSPDQIAGPVPAPQLNAPPVAPELPPVAEAQPTPVAQPIQPQPVPEPVKTPARVMSAGGTEFNDIIDFIANNIGAIRGKKSAKPGSEGYYGDNYRQLLNRNSVRQLFSNSRGSSPDQVVDDLRRANILPENATVDDLWEALDSAAAKRKDFRSQQTKQKIDLDEKAAQVTDFQKAAFTPRRGTSTIPVGEMLIGDKFKIGKEQFEVKNLHFDPDTDQLAYVEVEDGKRYGVQTIDGSQVIHAQSYVQNPNATDFLPVTEQTKSQAEVTRIDKELNQLREKKTLSPDDYRKLQMLEKERGQIMAFEDVPQQTVAQPEVQATPEQQRAEMLRKANAPLQGGDVRTQGQMFDTGPKETLFGQLGTLGGQPSSEPVPERIATTIPEIRQAILDSDYPEMVKRTYLAFLDTPALQNLDWSGLKVKIGSQTDEFRAARQGNLIELTENSQAQDLPHEVSHILYDVLPAAEKQAVEDARLAEIKKKYGVNPPEGLTAGTMTSEEFKSSGLSVDDYYLINPSEYLSTFAGNRFAQDFWNSRHGSAFIQKIAEWFHAMVDAIKRAFNMAPSMEQVLRQMFDGRYQPNLNDAIDRDTRQGTYARTTQEANNAARLAKTPEEKQVEGWHQLAQASDIVDFLVKHGVNAASTAAQGILDFFNYLGIRSSGERLNGQAATYADLKKQVTNPLMKNWIARLAAVHVNDYEGHLNNVIQDGDKAVQEASSPSFLKKLAREARLRSEMDNAENVDKASGALFETEYKRILKTLKEEAHNDVEIAQLEARLKEVDAARKSSSAMVQLANDIVNVLSSTAEGEAILKNPNATRGEYLAVYKDIKRSTDQPLHSDALLNWATYILAKNGDLKDQLWAAQLARNSSVRAQMSPYATKLMADIEKNPLGTIRREIRESKKRTSDYEKARFAWHTLNKDVVKQLTDLESRMEAAEVAQKVLQDPDWKGFKKEVFTDAGGASSAQPFSLTNDFLIMPDGTKLDIDSSKLEGSTNRFIQQRQKFVDAQIKLSDWLKNNVDHPDYWVHARSLEKLQDYFTELATLQPNDTTGIWNFAMTRITDAIKLAGGRTANVAKKALAKWDTKKRESGFWFRKYGPQLTAARLSALEAHGLLKKYGSVAANKLWFENVGNILAYGDSRQQGGWKVGDTLPSGWVVKKEDIAELRKQSESISAGISIAGNKVKDTMGRADLYRDPLKGSENMVKRGFNKDLVAFSDSFSSARKAFQQAYRDGDQNAMDAAESEMTSILNKFWGLKGIGKSLVIDRNADFARETIFDGPGGPLDVIGQRMATDPNYITSFDGLVNEVASMTTSSPTEAKRILMVEFGRIINDWNESAASDAQGSQILPTGKESENSTTRSRNKAMAPYAFYEYGFRNGQSVSSFAGAIHSSAMDELVAAMDNISKNFQGEIDQLKLNPNRKAAVNKREIERRNGENYTRLKNIEERKKTIDNILHALKGYDPDQDVDATVGRTIGAVTGLLISGLRTTVKNFTWAPAMLGSIINRLNGSVLTRHPIEGLINYLGSIAYNYGTGIQTALSYGLSAAKLAGIVPSVSIPKAVYHLAHGNLRKGVHAAFYDTIKEFGETALNRIKTVRDLQKAGIIDIPDFVRDFDNRILGSIMHEGRFLPDELSTLQKIAQGPAAFAEMILTILKTISPIAGDVSSNVATYRMMNSSFGPITRTEKRLKKFYLDWKRNPHRAFNFNDIQDPTNILSGEEVTGKTTEESRLSGIDMEGIRSGYADAGINFDEAAVKFLSELDKGNRNAQFLSSEQRQALSNKAIDFVNRPSGAQDIQALRKRNFVNSIVAPFMPFRLRAFQNMMMTFTHIPATGGKKVKSMGELRMDRFKMYSLLAATTVLPFLLVNALLFQPPAEETDRLMAKVMYNMEKTSRQPWERVGAKSQAIGWGVNAVNGIPFLDMLVGTMLNDLPVKGSISPSFAIVEKAQDLARFIGGVVQTGDVTFGLPEIIGSFVPDSKVVLNRLSSQEGKREADNLVALGRRYANPENIKPFGKPDAGPNYSELTPYSRKMANAAMSGDTAELKRLYDEAVDVATKMGRADPEKAVKAMFISQNPVTRIFKNKPSQEQMDEFLSRLTPAERTEWDQGLQKFKEAGDSLGVNVNMVKSEPAGSSGGSASYSLGSAASGYLRRTTSASGLSRASVRTSPTRTVRKASGLRRGTRLANQRRTLRRRTTRLRRR